MKCASFSHNFITSSDTIHEVIRMNQEKKEKVHQKKAQEKFNSVTNSVKPENQNQNHNVKKEGIGKQNNKF